MSTSARRGSVPGEVTHIIIPEGSGLLVIQPKLGSCSLPLTFVTKHDDKRGHPRGPPVFQTHSPLPPLGSSSPVSPGSQGQSPKPA